MSWCFLGYKALRALNLLLFKQKARILEGTNRVYLRSCKASPQRFRLVAGDRRIKDQPHAGATQQDNSTALGPLQPSLRIGLGAVSALLGRIQEAFQSSYGAKDDLKASEAEQHADKSTIHPPPEAFRQGYAASNAASGSAASTSGSPDEPASPSTPESEEGTPDERTLAQEVWAAAWQGLEPPDAASQQVAQEPTKSRWQRSRRAPSRQGGSNTSRETAMQGAGKACLALQGLKAVARVQLLALSLLALEMQLESLPADFVRGGTEAEWSLLLPVIFSSCSVRAARGWLKYVPTHLHGKAAALVAQLQEGGAKYSLGLDGPLQPSSSDLAPRSAAESALPATQPGLPVPSGPATAVTASTDTDPPDSLWEPAAEKRMLHAICIRDLCSLRLAGLTSAEDASMSCSSSRGQQTSATIETCMQERAGGATQSAESSVLAATSVQQASVGAEDTAHDIFGSKGGPARSAADTESTGKSGMRRAGGGLPRPFGWIFGGRRKQRASCEESEADEVQEEKADGALRTREAAMQLLTSDTGGIRGWGTASSSAGRLRSVAPSILQDMAVVIAEAVAICYLAEAGLGLDGGPAAASSTALQPGVWPTFLLPSLANTRALEKFRNQIAFQQLLEQNWGAVAAMYEDKHNLWGIASGACIVKRSVPARRAKDLQKLTGWQYVISLVLEALDFLTPLLRQLGQKGGDALSWLLVTLIGRSLGLVFRGVRHSLRPHKKASSPQQSYQYT